MSVREGERSYVCMWNWLSICHGVDLLLLFQDVLDWPTSRKFFYWRLRRRLCEQEALKYVMDADQ